VAPSEPPAVPVSHPVQRNVADFVDFTGRTDAVEATLEASRLRPRPILMTSFAFILGVVPLVITTGAGAEMRRALGTAVFSGMLGVTLFDFFLTLVSYYVLHWFGKEPARRETEVGESLTGPTPGHEGEARGG
jgi:Cu/Ag efflux pump CusA